MAPFMVIHPRLPPLRLTSRHGRLYTGPCPFCVDGGTDRFHVWMEASGSRPAERFWCRVCQTSGLLKQLDQHAPRSHHAVNTPPRTISLPERTPHRLPSEPRPEDIPAYRQLYAATALWAHAWLLDGCHPEPRAYLHARGLTDETISRFLLGVTLRDPEALVDHLRSTCPDAFPYAEAAGLLVTDDTGRLRTHWNLTGRIVFPYIANGEVVDLRTRNYGDHGGKGYRSLGPYEPRGAHFPFAWDAVTSGAAQPPTTNRTVIITESEFKALAALQAYDAGLLDAPTIGQPGLTVFREAWAAQLRAQGVNEVVLCYDSQPRTVKGGVPLLTPEEQWCLRHGGVCAAAGLQVRIARLPLRPGQEKEEIDTYLPREGATRFQRLIDQAPLLDEYHRSISSAMLDHHHLPVPSSYPVRRPRPTRLVLAETPQAYDGTPIQIQAESSTLAETRAAIVTSTAAHAATGTGFLVLAHPPGTGKGHNTTLGLQQWMGMGTGMGMGTEIAMERGMEHPAAVAQGAKPAGTTSATAKTTSGEQHGNGDGAGGHSGFLVWTALRKEQIQDQQGIPLIPLAGRNAGNCRKLPEAIVLVQKGYSVKDALCQRRCPHVQQCSYLKQFAQEGHFFASTPLLKATGWWEQAGALVLDEFDPASLIQHVHLSAADLALMSRSHGQKPAIQTMLRWVAQTLASTTDRTLGGMLFIEELARQAALDGADLATCLRTSLEELPTDEELNRLVGLPSGATLAEYQQLPPSHTARLLRQIDKEVRSQMMGRRQTSRLEARSGSLELSLRVEHLIEQLERPEQPKIILDATANAGLLRAIFPNTPVTVEQTSIRGALRVVQVVGRDWAKSTLVKRHRHRPRHEQRRTQWFDEVASAIRPGRPTLVVCTRECAEELREGLQARGFPSPDVVVDHYGGLRGSNAYKGYDVILAQVYHPNLDAIIREGRALFADDLEPLDTRMTVSNRLLRDGTGATWNIPVPTFADVRLAALLENRREAEMLQCALRGRPLDHPESQITLLFSLPIPGLSPTIIVEAKVSAGSNGGREQAVKARLCAAAQQLIEQGKRVLDVTMLARAAEVSVVTVRKHWAHIAARLHLTMQQRRRQVVMPRGGVRHYERQVLVRRGRMVRRSGKEAVHHGGERRIVCSTEREEGALDACTMDQADKRNLMTRVIHHHQPVRGRRRSVGRTKRVGDGAEWRWMWRVRQRDRWKDGQRDRWKDGQQGGLMVDLIRVEQQRTEDDDARTSVSP